MLVHVVLYRHHMELTQFEQAVAAELRAHVARLQITQVSLSEAIGLSQSQTSKILRATRPIMVGQLDSAARYLGVSVEAICSVASLRAEEGRDG